MKLVTKLIIGITVFIVLICAGYSATIFNTSSSNTNSSQIGQIEYNGTFLTPVENFTTVTSKYGERIHPITRQTELSYRY